MKQITKIIYFFLILCCCFNLKLFCADQFLDYGTAQNDRVPADIKLPLKLRWQKDYGPSSPILINDKLYFLEFAPEHIFGGKWNITICEINKINGERIGKKEIVGKVDNVTYLRGIAYKGNIYISAFWCDDRKWDNTQLYTYVFAYNPQTKKLLWDSKINMPIGISSGTMDLGAWLTASENKILLTTMGTIGPEPRLYCFDHAKGNVIWKMSIEGKINVTLPAIFEGIMYLVINNSPKHGGILSAYDFDNGKTIWQKDLIIEKKDKYGQADNDVWGMKDRTSLVYKDGLLYVPLIKGMRDGDFKIFRASDGEELWCAKEYFDGFLSNTPFINDLNCYLKEFDGPIYNFDIVNKKLIWKVSVESFFGKNLVLQTKDCIVYSFSGNSRNLLVFLSKKDGKEVARYDFTTPGAATQLAMISEVIPDGDNLLVMTSDCVYFYLEGTHK